MYRHVRLRALLFLTASCAPFTVCAQSQHPEGPHAKFSVDTSGPNVYYGVGIRDADLTFSADVSHAARYALSFGDGVTVKCNLNNTPVCADVAGVDCEFAPGSDHEIVCVHRYQRLENYTAELQAVRSSGEVVIPLKIPVAVKPPPPAPRPEVVRAGDPAGKTRSVSVQALPVVPVPPNRRKPWWPWLLVLAALAVLLGTFVIPAPVSTGTPDVRFEPSADLGRVRVVGSATVDEAISMQVRRDEGKLVIKRNDGEPQ